MTRALILAGLSLAALAAPLSAQVGYDPGRSPYSDLRETQEVTLFSGWYHAKKDPAQVAPQSGALAGALYQWRAGGPAHLAFSVARVSSQRMVLDPDLPACTATSTNAPTCKSIGTFRWPLYLFDGTFALSLTGARSFFSLVPEARAGAGFASDFHTQNDLGNFAFGTRFAFNWGAGIRFVPGGRFQLRADFVNHLYSVKYPESYSDAGPDGSRIFTQGRTSAWLNNPSVSLGLSYLFSR